MSDGMSDGARAERQAFAARRLAKQIEETVERHGDRIFPEAFAADVNESLAALKCPLRLEVRK